MRHYEGVGGGVQVGQLGRDLLVVDAGQWADLGEEEKEVTRVLAVAQAVQQEEKV